MRASEERASFIDAFTYFDIEPRSRGLPAGLLDRPFYGRVPVIEINPARFNGLPTEPCLDTFTPKSISTLPGT